MAFTAAVLGLGNIGRHLIQALEVASDAECIGVVRRKASIGKKECALRGVPDFYQFDDLCEKAGVPDVVILGLPARHCPNTAKEILSRGMCTVDCYDIRERVIDVVGALEEQAERGRAVAVTAAGCDPGIASMSRLLFDAIVPEGKTVTDFGRGISLGHTAAVRSLEGVVDAAAITVPLGGGRHSRLVHVVLEPGYPIEKVQDALAQNPYFKNNPFEVVAVDDCSLVADASNSVSVERIGTSAFTSGQKTRLDMLVSTPAIVAQVLVCAARAAVRLREMEHYGCYTLLDIPPIMLLPGEREDNLSQLV